MIDRTQLTEALDKAVFIDIGLEQGKAVVTLREAARLLLDFPTDKQVEANAKAGRATWDLVDDEQRIDWLHDARVGLEAVRRLIFQEDT